ncbi:hypothetical protein CRG98_049335, partial [Punica granatum]
GGVAATRGGGEGVGRRGGGEGRADGGNGLQGAGSGGGEEEMEDENGSRERRVGWWGHGGGMWVEELKRGREDEGIQRDLRMGSVVFFFFFFFVEGGTR